MLVFNPQLPLEAERTMFHPRIGTGFLGLDAELYVCVGDEVLTGFGGLDVGDGLNKCANVA